MKWENGLLRPTNNCCLMKIQSFPPVTSRSWLGESLGLLKSVRASPPAFSGPRAASLFCQTSCFRASSAWQALPLPWQQLIQTIATRGVYWNTPLPFVMGQWHQMCGFRRGQRLFLPQYESAEYHLFSFMLDNRFMLASMRKFLQHVRPFP